MAVVLVVDDEFGIVKLLKEALTDEGHRVLIATNGQRALERAAEEKPALVVTEFMMPITDGAAVVKAMAADAKLADVPVLSQKRRSLSAFLAAAFVRKPFNIFAIAGLVARLTGR
jgi:CheY-like chemotaxis protein